MDAKAFTAFQQAAHDRIAQTYAEHFSPLTSPALEPLLEAARVAAGRRLLDVATGPGLAAAAAYARGAKVTGVDVSPGMIAPARAAHTAVTFQVAEVTALPFADSVFDTVICNFGLGHFPKPEAALAECVRVLVAGGTLAFSWWTGRCISTCRVCSAKRLLSWGFPHPQACRRATIPSGTRIRSRLLLCYAMRGSLT
jgi:SAM-dependent methyltransferase